jgi:acyl-coenzyme A thioesterase PaaI-like protein
MGKFICPVEPDRKARLGMIPKRRHTNLRGVIHRILTLAQIDIALSATIHRTGTDKTGAPVIIELSAHLLVSALSGARLMR